MVMGELEQETQLLVIGSGPAGYAAAFRAADLGLEVTMVDSAPRPGGVCLFNGCIPSKSLLFLSEMIHDAGRVREMGLRFGEPRIDLEAVRQWKGRVVDDLARGLVGLCRRRGVQRIKARARFEDGRTVRLQGADIRRIRFQDVLVATGSRPVGLDDAPFVSGSRIMSSDGALALRDIPQRLLVVGGGYVGLELGSIYASLGSRVTLVEVGDRLLPGVDRDLVQPLQQRIEAAFDAILFHAEVKTLTEENDRVRAIIETGEGPRETTFDRVLVAVGRRPSSGDLGLELAGVRLDPKGFIVVDDRQRTSAGHIFAAGDVTGGAMLAHKASREGKVAAEVIAGRAAAFDVRAMPAVVYTDPQIAWCGLTEEQAQRRGTEVTVRRFPWKYSGRAATMGLSEGLTKIVIDAQSGRILGAGIVGRDTEGLIAEAVLAIEMGALAEDVALSIHPHPTLSETEAEAAELFLGGATHLPSVEPS